jgi:glycerophosphoryl diester phosphodiesterase
MFHDLRFRKALIGTWTVNNTERAKELASLGVDIIITDVPAEIISALEK